MAEWVSGFRDVGAQFVPMPAMYVQPRPAVEPGDRIRITQMGPRYRGPTQPGMRAVVTRVARSGLPTWEIYIRLDDGSVSMLVYPRDTFVKEN